VRGMFDRCSVSLKKVVSEQNNIVSDKNYLIIVIINEIQVIFL